MKEHRHDIGKGTEPFRELEWREPWWWDGRDDLSEEASGLSPFVLLPHIDIDVHA